MTKVLTVDIPAESSESAVIVAIHGRGSDPNDLAGLARALSIPTVRWVLPAAPIPMGFGFTWYQRPYTDLSSENRHEFEAARNLLIDLTRNLRAESGERPIIFLGFSQGGVLSMEMALRGPDPIDGAVNLSGALYKADTIADELSDSARKPPIFWGHGTQDGILPIGPAREQFQTLRSLGFRVEFREYAMDHSISAEELGDVKEFLSGLLGKRNG